MTSVSDNQMGKPMPANDEAREIFLNEKVKHGVLHKIWELHREDDKHHLHEVNKLKHLEFYKPITYAKEEVPYGINYFAKIELDDQGHCIHARAHKANDGEIMFHAVHWRKDGDGGAVFSMSDTLEYFDY